MVELRATKPDQLALLCEMDRDPDTREHITLYSLAEHQAEFVRDDIVYLSIYANNALSGYFILVLEADGESVEFRRIVVDAKGAGIGQAAIRAMEAYCAGQLRRRRIWLDVFASNPRGQHIYAKLGYSLFKRGELDGRPLLFMQKQLLSAHGE